MRDKGKDYALDFVMRSEHVNILAPRALGFSGFIIYKSDLSSSRFDSGSAVHLSYSYLMEEARGR